jgi:hypothetical protein
MMRRGRMRRLRRSTAFKGKYVKPFSVGHILATTCSYGKVWSQGLCGNGFSRYRKRYGQFRWWYFNCTKMFGEGRRCPF